MKYNIKANRSLTKISAKSSAIQFDVFDLFIIFSVSMSQQISAINKSGAFYFLHVSN